MEGRPTGEKLVVCLYFILTTLSTVGYGDFFPVATVEKIIGSIIMFCGVIYFSLLMGKFIDIVLSCKDNNMSENEKQLNKWMLLLRRFKNGKALSKGLRDDLNYHFRHFWDNNRAAALLEKKDFFDSLPKNIRRHLMTNYLYVDIFSNKIFYEFFDNGEMLDS